MAISPEEAAELSDNEREIIAREEARIDNYLRQEFIPGRGHVNVPIDQFDGRIIDRLCQRYLQAGWDQVELNDTNKRRWHIIFDVNCNRF
jgi:hypothetical protein